MTKFRVTGTVHLADGFEWDIEAETEASAREAARRLAHEEAWSNADLQEVCLEHIEAVLIADHPPPRHLLAGSVFRTLIVAVVAMVVVLVVAAVAVTFIETVARHL